MKSFAFAAALASLSAMAFAGPADDLMGTWECRVPRAPPTKTPPIAWFRPASADGTVPTAVDLDDFPRTVSGISDVASSPDGWLRVQPKDGTVFLVKPMPRVGGAPAMSLKRSGGDEFRCVRLPHYS